MRTGSNGGWTWATTGVLDLGILLTSLSLLLLGTTVRDVFQSLYTTIGSALPIPTTCALVPGLGVWIAAGSLAAALGMNLTLRRRNQVLVPGLALLLALSASVIAAFMFALVLPLMKLSPNLRP